MQWTTEQVCIWLSDVGLEHLQNQFRVQRVDGEDLMQFKLNDPLAKTLKVIALRVWHSPYDPSSDVCTQAEDSNRLNTAIRALKQSLRDDTFVIPAALNTETDDESDTASIQPVATTAEGPPVSAAAATWSPHPPAVTNPSSSLGRRDLPALPMDAQLAARQQNYEDLVNLSIKQHIADAELQEQQEREGEAGQPTPTPSPTELNELYSTVVKPHAHHQEAEQRRSSQQREDEGKQAERVRGPSPVSRSILQQHVPEDDARRVIGHADTVSAYFREHMSRQDAVDTIRGKRDGTFIITIPGAIGEPIVRFLLSVAVKSSPVHLAIDHHHDGVMVRRQPIRFETLAELVSYYHDHPLVVTEDLTLRLLHPGFAQVAYLCLLFSVSSFSLFLCVLNTCFSRRNASLTFCRRSKQAPFRGHLTSACPCSRAATLTLRGSTATSTNVTSMQSSITSAMAVT